MRKLIFVVSPLRAEKTDPVWPPLAGVKEPPPHPNLVFAKQTCLRISLTGNVPFAPHVYFTQFLRDEEAMERVIGIQLGLEVLSRADEVFVRLPPWRKHNSTGMLTEIGEAERIAKPVYNVTDELEFRKHILRLQKEAQHE